MIAQIHITLDKPRVLTVDAVALARFKKVSGVDLVRGDVFSGHWQTVQFIWALAASKDPSVTPTDLAPFVTAEAFATVARELVAINQRQSKITPGRN